MKHQIFDTETCGYHGPTVLIQYAGDDGPINLHEVWCVPIYETLELIESFCEEGVAVVGFNLIFDWFHLCQTYTVLKELASHVGEDAEPRDYIDLYASLEPIARDGPCVKPYSALDLMLYARKGPFQETMDRKDIRIKRVPRQLGVALAHELTGRIHFEDYLFARKKDPTERWKIYDSKCPKTGKPEPDFVDLVLKFAPSSALKVLAGVVLGISKEEILVMSDVAVKSRPLEVGWAPFALAIATEKKGWWCEVGAKKGRAWPGVIEDHIAHWRHYPRARKYATDDVVYTRGLFNKFREDDPELEVGDNDSMLACQMGASRWRGFAIDLLELRRLRDVEVINVKKAPKAPQHVYRYLTEVMTPTEKVALDEEGSTKKIVLERLSDWKTEEGKPTEVAIRAAECLGARKAHNKITLFNKLIQAGRLHPSGSVIGSLSGRMSGRTEVGDGKRSAALNALGIQHDKKIRRAFPLAFGDLTLCGGDFAAFEVGIADARYNDPGLRTQLLTCVQCEREASPDDFRADTCPHCGAKGEPFRKIHGLFAMALFPGNSYEDIAASKGTDDDLYDKGKRGFFGGLLYGGDENTLHNRIGIDLEVATEARIRFLTHYKGIQDAQQEIYDRFCSMRQPDGLGKQVIWHDPEDYVESLNGFRRYFTLENRVTKILFDLANKPPRAWRKLKSTVVRREYRGPQKIGGAVQSALFAAAFAIQGSNMRAATNHEIQSTGAIICKALQAELYRLQPTGVHPWRIQALNIHDELMVATLPEIIPEVEELVEGFIQKTKDLIPLIKIDWSSNLKSWAEK